MRKLFATVIASVAVLGTVLLIPAAASAKTCPPGYKHGVIGGEQKCLHRGEFCSHYHANQYHRYGFNCVYKHGYYFLEPRR